MMSVTWKSHLLSSARTGLACIIAALLLQYAHGYFKWTSFPTFAFVLSFVLMGDSPSLAIMIDNSCSVIIGGVQGVSLGMLVINLQGPTVRMWTSLLWIFATSVVIAYPTFSSLLTKRISLTMAVHLHVIAYAQQQHMDRVYYPVKLGGTVLLGLVCSVVALAFPIPKLESIKVKHQIIQCSRKISQAFDTLLTIFTSREGYLCQSLRLQARSFVEAGSELVLDVHNVHPMECVPFVEKARAGLDKLLNKLMLQLRAMELAMKCREQFPESTKSLLKDSMLQVREWSKDLFAVTEKASSTETSADKLLKNGKEMTSSVNEALKSAFATFDNPQTLQAQISSLFFVHNMNHFLADATSMLQTATPRKIAKVLSTVVALEPKEINASKCSSCKKSEVAKQPEESNEADEKAATVPRWLLKLYSREQSIVTLKISLAMVLGTFASYMYDPYHSMWTTLIIGMGLNAHRDGSLRISDVKLHGIALGTMFGYLVSVYTENCPSLSIVAMAGWIVFTSFMKHNRRYGQLGNVSALIGAIFLVGHQKRVSLDRLGMLRLTESFLGIASLVLVDYLVFPRKVAPVAQSRLEESLEKLNVCTGAAVKAGAEVMLSCESCHASTLEEFDQARQEASSAAKKLSTLVRDAATEPCGWSEPCVEKAYTKILSSQGRILDLLQTLEVSIFELRSRSLSGCREILEDLQPGVGLTLLRQKLPEVDIENQPADVVCWSSEMVNTCREKFQEVMLAKNVMSWEETLVFGAFIFNAQALALEFSKVEHNVLKLVNSK